EAPWSNGRAPCARACWGLGWGQGRAGHSAPRASGHVAARRGKRREIGGRESSMRTRGVRSDYRCGLNGGGVRGTVVNESCRMPPCGHEGILTLRGAKLQINVIVKSLSRVWPGQ
ncbi:60 kDa chaperonin, partial [Frankliniella fusca]